MSLESTFQLLANQAIFYGDSERLEKLEARYQRARSRALTRMHLEVCARTAGTPTDRVMADMALLYQQLKDLDLWAEKPGLRRLWVDTLAAQLGADNG